MDHRIAEHVEVVDPGQCFDLARRQRPTRDFEEGPAPLGEPLGKPLGAPLGEKLRRAAPDDSSMFPFARFPTRTILSRAADPPVRRVLAVETTLEPPRVGDA